MSPGSDPVFVAPENNFLWPIPIETSDITETISPYRVIFLGIVGNLLDQLRLLLR